MLGWHRAHTLAENSTTGDRTSAACHSTSWKQYSLNHVSNLIYPEQTLRNWNIHQLWFLLTFSFFTYVELLVPKSITLVWRCHQLLSGFLAKGHLPRMSRKWRLSEKDDMSWSRRLYTDLLAFALRLRKILFWCWKQLSVNIKLSSETIEED